MAKKTITLTIDTGAYDLGPVPPDTRVTLEARYLWAKECRSPLSAAFELADIDARNRVALERIAEHVIVSWSVSPEIDHTAVAAFLLALLEEHPPAALQIIERLADRKRFGVPTLVDAEELGKE